jgi:hypothetical protein
LKNAKARHATTNCSRYNGRHKINWNIALKINEIKENLNVMGTKNMHPGRLCWKPRFTMECSA